MNRLTRFVHSKQASRAAMAGLTAVAATAVVTLPHDGSLRDPVTSAVEAALATATPQTAGWDLPNIDNARVDSWIKLFTTDPKVKARFAVWLDRKSEYEPMISAKLEQHDMPQDLIYLAMIESGFNPKAQSPAKAGGLWQFISETGKRYGLTVNKKLDERNVPAKATDAALSYLSDLHERFGSWYLAAAAYNTGENRVGRIMREVTGSERGTDEDYYRISPRLPAETREYVPMMIAAARISKDPQAYGFAGNQTLASTRAGESGGVASAQETAQGE
jgi:peptidoglycan lytic transglycosylase D